MALIDCPECKRQISDKAPACPHCGNPMMAATLGANVGVETRPGKAVTTQATGKVWKVIQLIGFLICVMGVIIYVGGTQRMTGINLLFLGALVFLVGRFGGWWKHG